MKNIKYNKVEYLKTPLSKNEILSLSEKLGKTPGEFIRKSEMDFKNNFHNIDINDDEKTALAISEFPKLMERPILVKGNQAIIGRPPENILSLIT